MFTCTVKLYFFAHEINIVSWLVCPALQEDIQIDNFATRIPKWRYMKWMYCTIPIFEAWFDGMVWRWRGHRNHPDLISQCTSLSITSLCAYVRSTRTTGRMVHTVGSSSKCRREASWRKLESNSRWNATVSWKLRRVWVASRRGPSAIGRPGHDVIFPFSNTNLYTLMD